MDVTVVPKLETGEFINEITKNEEFQCLVCSSRIETLGNIRDNFQLNQLHDLLKVFQISLASIGHLSSEELPWSLFCGNCADRIIDAAQLLLRIECLQKDFSILRKLLRRDLMNNWDVQDGCNSNGSVGVVRKTLVQCLSPCQVLLKQAGVNGSSEKNLSPETALPLKTNLQDGFESTDFAGVDDGFAELPSASMKLRTNLIERASKGFYRRGGTTSEDEDQFSDEESEASRGDADPEVIFDDEYQPTDEEHGEVDKDDQLLDQKIDSLRKNRSSSKVIGGVKSGGRTKKPYPIKCDKCGKGLISQHALSVHEAKYCGALVEAGRAEGPSGQRIYDDNGKLIAYDCPFCIRKISREDYSTETGNYLFKCFPDCCDKVMDNFFNLMVHHDAFCPSKPVELHSITRKSKSSKPSSKSNASEANESNRSINVREYLTYDDNKAVIGFKCPRCETSLSRSDFLVESGEFIFKCEWDSCNKNTSTLSNLAFHHATHCSNSNNQRRKRKSNAKIVKIENDISQTSGETSEHPEQNPVKSPKLTKVKGSQIPRKRGRPKRMYPFNCQKCGKGFLYESVLSLHEARHGVLDSQPEGTSSKQGPSSRVYEDGKLVAYNCQFCQRKLSEKDYLTESGEYIFKCFEDCCDKITGKFINLLYHHEAFCPSKPKDLYSNKRKYRRNTRQRREGLAYNKRSSTNTNTDPESDIQNSEDNTQISKHITQNPEDTSDPKFSDVKSVDVQYDEDGKLIGYDCPFCNRKLYREDYYSPEAGIYHFKCFPDYCDKSADNFNNLITHHKSCCPMAPPKPKRVKKRATSERVARAPVLKTGHRVHDNTNKLVSFECSFCQRVMSREAYLTEPGNYIFKCFPDCCDKIMDHFSNLVSHHEAYCKQRPMDLYSKTRKSLTVSKSEDPSFEDATNQEAGNSEPTNVEASDLILSGPAVKAGRRVYDDNTKLIRFECPFCEKTLSKEDYFCSELSDYLFKCFPECCDKTTDNFPNLVYHHEAFCPSKPVELYSKKTHRRLKERLKVGSSNKMICVSKGFKFNNSRSVIAFECPRCQKQMAPTDFQTESGEFVFKCGWNSCDKITTTFANLAYHHEAHCADRPRKPKWKPIRKLNVIGRKDKETPSERRPKKEKKKSLDPVYCDQCGKAFKKRFDLVRHMVSHSDEKPFACDQCPYRCKRNKNLRIHMRLHNDERPFLCPTCGKTFRSSSALNHHEKSHGTGTFACSFCNRMFKSQHDLNTHMMRIHSHEAADVGGGHSGTSSLQLPTDIPYGHNFDLGSLWNPML